MPRKKKESDSKGAAASTRTSASAGKSKKKNDDAVSPSAYKGTVSRLKKLEDEVALLREVIEENIGADAIANAEEELGQR